MAECQYGSLDFTEPGKCTLTFPNGFEESDESEFVEWFTGAFSCWWNCYHFRKRLAKAAAEQKPKLHVVPESTDGQ